jgi:hypothetical protein
MRLQYEGKRRDLSLIFIIIFSDFDVLTVILHLLFFFVFFLQMFTSCFLDNQYLILILLIMICYYPGRINIWKDWRMAVWQEILSQWSSTKEPFPAPTRSSWKCGMFTTRSFRPFGKSYYMNVRRFMFDKWA